MLGASSRRITNIHIITLVSQLTSTSIWRGSKFKKRRACQVTVVKLPFLKFGDRVSSNWRQVTTPICKLSSCEITVLLKTAPYENTCQPWRADCKFLTTMKPRNCRRQRDNAYRVDPAASHSHWIESDWNSEVLIGREFTLVRNRFWHHGLHGAHGACYSYFSASTVRLYTAISYDGSCPCSKNKSFLLNNVRKVGVKIYFFRWPTWV